ncbi:15222_t:CDS:2, partial [Racocetra persica]
RCFFVPSAFLLTFRSMLDWERYHETIENKKNIETNARNESGLESKTDLEADLTDPLLSKTDCDNIWRKHQIAIKLWLKFFLRRFMRVYPPYAILLLIIAYNDFVRKAYHERINTSNLVPHLLLQEAKFTFWTIPPEIKYYLCIPIIVIGYVELTRFGAYLTNYFFGRPNIGAWISRILCNIILMIVREIIRLGLLPLSLNEENVLVSKSSNFNEVTHTNLSFMKWFIKKFPRMPRIRHEKYEVKLENSFGGFLYASLILVGLLSRD